MAHTEWVFYSFPSRIVGQATCGIWTMPPGMELVYDPQFDLDDSNDKEIFQISFNLVNERNWTNTVQQGLAWNTIFESLKSMTKRKKWNFIWICKTNSYFWSQDWRFSYHGELQFSNLLSRDNFWNTNNDFCNKISQTRVSFLFLHCYVSQTPIAISERHVPVKLYFSVQFVLNKFFEFKSLRLGSFTTQ